MIDFQSILFVNLTVFSDLSFWKFHPPFFLKYYSFLMCKPSRSVSPKLFSPPFPKLSILLEGNAVCVLVSSFLNYFHLTQKVSISIMLMTPNLTLTFRLSLSYWISHYISISAYSKKNSCLSHDQFPHLTSLHNSLKRLTDGYFVMEQHSLSHTQHCFSSAWQQ